MNTSKKRVMNNFYGFGPFLNVLGFVFLISPPRAIDLTASQRASQGELAKQPLFIIMLVELMIRIAGILLLATSLEFLLGNRFYETIKLDTGFSIIVAQGVLHSLCYYLTLGYLKAYIGITTAMRIYRLLRNLCYSVLPGFAVILPIVLWRTGHEEPLYADGIVFQIYIAVTVAMMIIGEIEALVMQRKPLGLDDHL